MNNKWIRIAILTILFVLLFFSDFVRDYFFKNVGFQIFYLEHVDINGISTVENYTDSMLENWLQGFSIPNLINLKWLMTVFFCMHFGFLSSIISFLFFRKKIIVKYVVILYSFLFIAGGFVYLTRYLSSNFEWQNNTYLISMQILHFLQSSLPTLLFLASFKIYLSYKESEVNK